MRNFEIEGELWDYISGLATRPDPKNKNYLNLIKHWESMNATARSIIDLHVDRSLKKLLANINSAKDAWDYLALLYAHHDESNLAKTYRLEREIEAVKQSGFPLTGLYCFLQCYWQQLDEMEPKELSDLESYKKYREESRLVQLLMALPDIFDEDIRKSMLERSPLPTVPEAVRELLFVEHRLTYDKFSSLSLHDKDFPAKKMNNDQTKRSYRSQKGSPQFGGCQPSIQDPIEQSDRYYQPSSSSSRLASPLTPDNNQPALSTDQCDLHKSILKSQLQSELSGQSPLECGIYVPPFRRERNSLSMVSSRVKILSYNVWFGDLEIHNRMEALGELIQLHSPDVICFQEVTLDMYDIFKVSSWWNTYNCSVSHQMASTRRYFCMQLSKLPVKSFSCKPFSNSTMLRELCMAEIEVRGKLLIVATSHLESPCPAPPKWDQMHSEERIAQAKEAVNLLKKFPNVVFCGDMNWDENLDGKFPLSDGWIDAWADLRPGENGWTYDTVSNPMLSSNRPLQKRPDRFICNLCDFKLSAIDMIGMEAIPGVSYKKGKKVRKGFQKSMLPVLPSGHYGLLLGVNVQ
nr:tyrosyl-dna phosphodiesterase 2 [Quercus suber]